MDSRHAGSRRHLVGLAAAITSVALAGVVLISAGPAQAARTVIPAETAQAKVTKKVPGDVVSVKRTKRDGFASWAVTVERADGSIVVGYVDRASGIIFDWTVQKAPGEPVIDLDGPAATLTPAKPPTTTVTTTTTQGTDSTDTSGSGSTPPADSGGSAPTTPAPPADPGGAAPTNPSDGAHDHGPIDPGTPAASPPQGDDGGHEDHHDDHHEDHH